MTKRSVVVRERPSHPVFKEAHEAEKLYNVGQAEIKVSEPVPIERNITVEGKVIAPIYSAPEPLPAGLSREEIKEYIYMLQYGETIEDMEYAARALGGRGIRAYITTNDPVINDIYSALVSAFSQNNDEILLREIAKSLGKLGREEAGSSSKGFA